MSSRSRCTRIVLIVVAAGVTAASPARAASGDADFRQGIAAYRSGDLESALALFQRAYDEGVRNPNLDFDLGLAHYRLGHATEARVAFERLARNPAYALIATYHLALLDARAGEDEHATARLRDVEARTDSPRLRELAQLALHRIGAETAAPTWSAYASLGAGYDSDPLLVSEAVREAVGEKADGFAALQAGFDVPVATTQTTTLAVRADAYLRQYKSDTELDQQGIELGVHEMFGASWRTDLSLVGATAFVGGDNLEDAGGVAARTAHAFGDSTLRLGYRLDRVHGGSSYGYLTGWRHRADADYAFVVANTRARLEYGFEANDRRDLEQNGQFFSQSPMRHYLGLRARHEVSDRWQLEGRAHYRRSDYRDPDRFLDGTTQVEQTRRENLYQAAIDARWRFASTWDLALEYEYSNNRSNFAGFTYDRHVVSLSLEWLR